jgi:DnaK suppressor protein
MGDLTSEQTAELHDDLRSLERELRALLESSAEQAQPVDLDEPIGRLSRVDAMQQQSMLQANRGAMQRRRQQVEAALRRIEQGDYGDCAECGEEIGLARLKVKPETALCIQCQTQQEGRSN